VLEVLLIYELEDIPFYLPFVVLSHVARPRVSSFKIGEHVCIRERDQNLSNHGVKLFLDLSDSALDLCLELEDFGLHGDEFIFHLIWMLASLESFQFV